MQKASDFLTTAAQLVDGERARTHGEKQQNFAAIARLWNGYLRNAGVVAVELTPRDCSNLMALMKIARTQSGGSHNPDNYVDGAGYIGISGELAERGRGQ